ncbi:MAG: protein kinase [Proteobacteria bacterium]|nr:protein kinase [Pseudomonadota bacterium]
MAEQKSDGAENASDADIVALKPGTRIGRHEVLAVLGQGGFGITYRASDGQLHREVAIKEYLPTLLAYRAGGTTVMPRSTKVAEDFAWGRDRFVAEGRTLASLHHAPGIVRVFDFLETNGTAYIVMEMLRGDTLEARIKAGPPLDGAEVDRILRTLLDGLEQVHDAGFLHRDIKPANILLDAKGHPTLIDFGASRAAMTGRTVAMTAIFTPGYAATEQMTSAKQGPWTDIYGLSATLYHAITGEPPPNAFDRLLDDEYKPLARLAPQGFSPGLIAGIDAGLAVRASDRPQSIAGWRALLAMSAPAAADATQLSASRQIDPDATMLARAPASSSPASSSPASQAAALALSSTVQPPSSSPSQPAPSPKSRAPLYAGVAAAVLLLAAGGGYLALSPSTPEPAAAPQTVVLQDLKVEDLERALAERRAADAAAAEKRRLEEEAQRKVEADAAAKQAADAELVKAEAARKAAEEELARLKTEIEARRLEAQNEARRAEAEAAQRKAEAEMAALRQAEEDARRKAAAEAETKRLADEALARAQAERLRTEEEAQKKAAAEKKEKADATARQIAEAEAQEKAKAQKAAEAAADAKAKEEAEAAARKAAEAAEAGLRLGLPERQKVQVALSSLGFDTRGNDGALGPRSREMVAAWQKARNRPATGFLDGAQHEALTREASAALQKYDADQKKKAEDEKKAAEEAAKAKAATPAPVPTPAPAPAAPAPSTATAAATAPAGGARWTGIFKCDLWPGTGVPIALVPVNGKASHTFPGRGGTLVTVTLSGNQVSGSVTWRPRIGEKTLSGSFSATIQGNSVTATTTSRSDFKGGPGPDESQCTLTLSRAG